MGRPRQPVDLLLIKGKKNLTKKEIEERRAQEVKAPADNVKAPSYLPAGIKKEFDRLAAELTDIKIMTNLDCEALARFVMSEYNYQRVSKRLLRVGVENPKFRDLLIDQEKLFRMCRQAASDLGLTISSRCKLVVPKQEEKKEENPVNRMFGNV
jgi:P27 family predicted phage terminase small subunit